VVSTLLNPLFQYLVVLMREGKEMKHGNKNYLLLFGDKMYVYRTYYKDLIELNEFTKKHYKKAQKLIKKVELSGYFR